MANQVFTVTIPIDDPGGDNKQIFLLKAPAAANGGAIRVVDAVCVNGAATGSGTSFSFSLHRYSSAATPAVNGTIAAAVGGTATPFSAGVPQAFTIDAAYNTVSAGEYVVGQYNEQTNGNPTNCSIMLTCVVGK